MVKNITADNFKKYGRIIEYPQKPLKGNKRNLWRIVLNEAKPRGWRIAYLVLRDKRLNRLESHPYSFESFEPVKGKSLIFVTKKCDHSTIECFHLNKPIILNKGIWHGLITLTAETEIKITENDKVKCVFWPLKSKLSLN